MEKVYTTFEAAQILGKYNEGVIAHEFEYQGIPVRHSEGKDDFDFYLPNGKTIEWKMDIRSQCTGAGAIEDLSLKRRADYYGYTFTMARLYPFELLQALYNRGKLPDQGFGPQRYNGRYSPRMWMEGQPFWQFLRNLKST